MKKTFKRWPLSVSTFTLRDKLKVAWHTLIQDHYTMGSKVAAFEERMAELSGMHALGVSSGSSANHVIFELWKLRNPGCVPIVICPAVTWISSITPVLMAGMEVKFCDVNREDLSFDYKQLKQMIHAYRAHKRKVIIWPTALLGHVPDMGLLRTLAAKYKCDLYLDSCENTLSRIGRESILGSCEMTTTSCYFAHQVQAIEFGFVFFRDAKEYQIGRMFRNQGMARSLTDTDMLRKLNEENYLVDPKFLFAVPGTNYRPTDLNAVFGLCDLARADEAEQHRTELYLRFRDGMDHTAYFNPPFQVSQTHFCLPIFYSGSKVDKIKERLNSEGIETRPIVGGNLLRQPCLKHLGKWTDFPNAEFIHRSGFYIGLHKGVTIKMIDWLCDVLISMA